MTLMFQKHGRQWDTVGYIALNGHIHLHSRIFPNEQYGFNGRKLIVTTLDVSCLEAISLMLRVNSIACSFLLSGSVMFMERTIKHVSNIVIGKFA